MKLIDNHPKRPKMELTERGRFARDSLIALGALGVGTLVVYNIANGSDGYDPGTSEIVCTTQMLEPNLESFAEEYLGAESPGEKKRLADQIGRQSKLNDSNDVARYQQLSLTGEQCTMVVGEDGEVTYLDPVNQ